MKPVLITSSILIVLVAALRPILRGKIDPRMQYALWLIVALRLLVPVDLAHSAYSALALLDRAEEQTHLAETISQFSIPAQSYQSAWNQALSEFEQNGGIPSVVNTYEDLDAYERMEYRAHALMEGPTLAELAAKYAKPVWLGGAALMAAWFLLVNLRLRQKLSRAELIAVERDSGLPVFVSTALPSPCLCGAVRPAIYVTPPAAEDPDRLRHVLAHESTHYRHRDHWWALVRCLCLCLYWFDLLVWWAAALSRQDCELACDAGAIRRLGEKERLSYGRTLVDMISSGRSSLLQTATTMSGGKRRVRERVTLIAHKPKTVIALALALVLVLGLAVGCTFTGAPEESDPTLSADTLVERLMAVPEELRSDVTARSSDDPNCLVEYWSNIPADWEDEEMPWLLSVYRWDQAQFDAKGYPAANDTSGSQMFAQDGRWYYSIVHPLDVRFEMEDSEAFTAAYQAIRAYAEKTVLETEGVEPFSPDQALGVEPSTPDQALAADSLQTRLMTVPEELRDKVSASPAMGGEVTCIASYWLNDPKWADLWSGWLLDLYRMDETQIQEKLDNGLWPAVDIFARSGDEYYAVIWPADGRYQDGSALSDEYWSAANAIKDHVKKTILETEGTEPFDPYTTPPHFFSNVKRPPMEPGAYAYNDLDYTLVTSYQQVPEDPEQWYLVGYMPDVPVWMFTRDHGQETMFQFGEKVTQIFPYTARIFSQVSADGRAPQLMPLNGFGWGPKGTSGPFAVITHVFQGGTDQLYQLTVYDLDTDPVASYVHDWEPLMNDFNSKSEVLLHDNTHSATISYQGQSVEIHFNEAEWENVQQYGFSARIDEYIMTYSFNSDGTFNLEMPINPFTTPCIAVWTLRFTGSGFETAGFRFVQADDVYLYISAPH